MDTRKQPTTAAGAETLGRFLKENPNVPKPNMSTWSSVIRDKVNATSGR